VRAGAGGPPPRAIGRRHLPARPRHRVAPPLLGAPFVPDARRVPETNHYAHRHHRSALGSRAAARVRRYGIRHRRLGARSPRRGP
jgi:hypothetical protein